MVVLRLGKINNEERKFIPTKKEYLERYLNRMELIEEYELLQTYKDGYKYRRYNDKGNMKYTRNNKMSKITEVEEIDEKTFQEVIGYTKKWIRKIRRYYKDGPFEIDVDYFLEPIQMIMVEVSTDEVPLETYISPKGFIEVSNTKTYENYGIYHGSIISNSTIIEGTDGVGKTSVIEALIQEGIICQDRCMDVISKNMLFHISMEERVKIYSEYLKKLDKNIIILVNNSKEELEERINKREKLSEYDTEAFRYNQLYFDTFQYMKKKGMLQGKMHLVDCTHMDLETQINAVRNVILNT